MFEGNQQTERKRSLEETGNQGAEENVRGIIIIFKKIRDANERRIACYEKRSNRQENAYKLKILFLESKREKSIWAMGKKRQENKGINTGSPMSNQSSIQIGHKKQ